MKNLLIYLILQIVGNPGLEFSYKFAEFLEKDGDYFRAILEYKKVFYALEEDNPLKDTIAFKIIELYEKLGNYQDALKYVEKIKNKNSQNYAFEKGRIYFLLGDYKNARAYWSFSDTLVGWTYLREGNLAEAINYIGPVNLKKKSPVLACALSLLIPGLGKFYADRTLDGLSSLLLHVTAGYLAYSAYRSGQKTSFYIYSSLFGFLYLGNIYGSYWAAKQYNDYHLKLAITQKEIELGLWRYLP